MISSFFLLSEVFSEGSDVANQIAQASPVIYKRGVPFKRLPGWSVYYGKRSLDTDSSEGGMPEKDIPDNYLSELSGNDKIDDHKYDNKYRVELQKLLSSFDHLGSINRDDKSGEIESIKDIDFKEDSRPSGNDKIDDEIFDRINTSEENPMDFDNELDSNSLIDERSDYSSGQEKSSNELAPFEDVGKRSGWSAVYGKRMPGWFATYGKRLSGWSPMYGKRAPGWSVTYGKRAPVWQALYGKRAPGWQPTYGKRSGEWQAIYGKRAPAWQALYGKRAPAWQAVYGKRAPAWQALYGKRAPAWQALYGKRAPAWQAVYGKRGPAWQAVYGKRAPAWQAVYGKRAPAWQAVYGKREDVLNSAYEQNDVDFNSLYNKRAPAWHVTYGKRVPGWKYTYGKKAAWLASYGKRSPAWQVAYGKRYPAWQSIYGNKNLNSDIFEVSNGIDVNDDESKNAYNSDTFQSTDLARTR